MNSSSRPWVSLWRGAERQRRLATLRHSMVAFCLQVPRLGKVDAVIALVLMAAMCIVGMAAVGAGAAPALFYQEWFAPAVMQACGNGFVNVATGSVASLDAFLAGKQAVFSCVDLPATLQIVDNSNFQNMSRYLMGAVALTWRVTGTISWGALLPLYGILFAATAVFSFLLCRIALSRAFAIAATLVFVLSSTHVYYLSQLRDYAKAPFILAMLVLMTLLVVRPFRRQDAMVLSALCGVVLGGGLGFRMDLLACVPLYLFVLFFLTEHPTRQWMTKLVCGFLFVFALAATAWPVLAVLGGGGNTFHVIVLGLMSPFDSALGLIASPVYEFGHLYNDSYVYTMAQFYAQQVHGLTEPIVMASREYERSLLGIYAGYVMGYPADWVARIYGATIEMLEGQYYLALIVAFFIAQWRVRWAIYWCVVLLFFGAVSSLQFGPRHYFHLLLFVIFIKALLAQGVLRVIPGLRQTAHGQEMPSRRLGVFTMAALRGLILVASLVALCGAVLWIARLYQQARLDQLIESVIAAPKQQLRTLPRVDIGGGKLLIPVDHGGTRLSPTMQSGAEIHRDDRKPTVSREYWIATLSPALCSAQHVDFQWRYGAVLEFDDYSRRKAVWLGKANGKVYLASPVYWTQSAAIQGVVLPSTQVACLERIDRVVAAEETPIIPALNLAPNWRNEPRYAFLSRIETGPPRGVFGLKYYTQPADLDIPASNASSQTMSESDVQLKHAGVHLLEGSWDLNARAAPNVDLLQWREHAAMNGDVLVVEGENRGPGFAIGLLQDKRWFGQNLIVNERGYFVAAIKIERTGSFVAAISNLGGISDGPDFTITKVTWMRPKTHGE